MNSCYHTFLAIVYFIYIIHFIIELFFWYYIHNLFSYNFVQKLALFCINIVPKLPSNHAWDSMISSSCRIRRSCKATASVYFLFLIVDCEVGWMKTLILSLTIHSWLYVSDTLRHVRHASVHPLDPFFLSYSSVGHTKMTVVLYATLLYKLSYGHSYLTPYTAADFFALIVIMPLLILLISNI